MSITEKFKHYINTEHLFSPKDGLLLAVSGGLDSVVLCELCRQAGFDFVIAHCNFQLRGEESDGDEKFVESLAKKYEVQFFLKRFDAQNYADQHKLSIQVAARELRYNWFKELTNKETASNLEAQSSPSGAGGLLLLTAHHADDNIETILMNFFKGSGINGLKGMLPKQNGIIRPLLSATREEILAFAKENNLTHREDSSNSSDKYTRNYFRNQLIPRLEKVFPQVKENLLHNAVRFKEINMIYQSAIGKMKEKLLTKQGSEIHIPVLKLAKHEALHTLLYEIIKDYGFTAHQTADAEKLLYRESGKYIESSTHRILRNRKWLIIAPLNNEEVSQYLIKENDTVISFPPGKLNIAFAEIPGKIESDAFIAQLDAKDIQFPLLLRKWKKGDYFYPLGMPKKKKLSRFFTDIKLSLIEKENAWVIESNRKIIWVVGKRIDDRFKISGSTKKTIRLVLKAQE
jgi:tRNA(Ile)-lysidine synthase